MQSGKLSIMFFNKIKDFLQRDIYITLLTGVFFVVFFTNYKFGTTLIGWDSLQTELNPISNISRNFSSVWQEYQGLGSVVGNAHAVEFIRNILLYPFTIFFPNSFVRYFYIFLMLYVGVISTYLLLKDTVFSKDKNPNYFAFCGALFYLFNLGTVQNFYVPFEPFVSFYAFLPLSFLYLFKYVNGKISLIPLIFVFLLTTFSFEVPTIFVVYSLIIGPLIAYYLLYGLFAKQKALLNKSLKIILSLFVVNIFWIGSFFYFLLTNLGVRFSSVSGRLSSENASLLNDSYSNFTDISILRGFWFSNIDYINSEGKFGYMFSEWASWIGKNQFEYIGFALFFIVVLGFLFTIFRPNKYSAFFTYIFFISTFFLFGTNGFVGYLYYYLIASNSILNEAFRFSFTKWVVPGALSYALLFAIGLKFILRPFINLKPRFLSLIFAFAIPIAIVIYVFPVFRGNLIYEFAQNKIPSEYFQLNDYLSSLDKNSRVVLLPAHSIWGWSFTDWGYRGSGFLWYGSDQSFLSRTFDVWNTKNEQFYNEFQFALYSNSKDLLVNILDKYDVKFLILDKNIISPESDRSLYVEETLNLFSEIPQISIGKEFGNIIVYRFQSDVLNSNSYVLSPLEFSYVNSRYEFSNIDGPLLGGFLSYVSRNDYSGPSLHFPFSDDRVLANTENYLIDYPSSASDNIYSVVAPGFDLNSPLPALVSFNSDNIEVSYLRPKIVDSKNNVVYENQYNEVIDVILDPSKKILFNNKPVELTETGSSFLIKPDSTIVSYDSFSSDFYDFSDQIYSSEVNNCSGSFDGVAKSYDKYPGSVIISSDGGSVCLDFDEKIENTTDFVYEISYLYKNASDSKQTYCLYSENEKKCLNEKYKGDLSIDGQFKKSVDYVIAKGQDKLRFSLISDQFNNTKSEAVTFKDIKVYRYPLTQIKIFSPSELAYSQNQEIFVAKEQFPLQILMPDYKTLNRNFVPGDFEYNIEANNCDNFNEKEFARDYSILDGRPLFRYSALDAISCDNLETPVIDVNSDYLIAFDSRNISGKSLDICIAGIDLDKCLIQERLNGNGRESFILPSYPSAESVGINIGNQSIGNVSTENEFYGVGVKYFPYKWLKGIYVKPKNAPEFYENGVKLLNVDKKAIYKYEVDVEKSDKANVGENGLIILNQSFEDGWGLYEKDSCLFGITTPFTCKKANAQHVLAKNWANAWVVPAEDASYVIIFWPQYLQFLGYLVLITFIIVLMLGIYNKRTKTGSRA